jgi:hypothetical protein
MVKCTSSVAIVAALLAAACGSTAEPPEASTPGELDNSSSVEIVVVLPVDWPSPAYPGRPVVVVEGIDGAEVRIAAPSERVTVDLPASGDYSVGAVIEDGGCFDTAGVADAGNPPVALDDGDVVRLQDTGELCD